MPIKLSNEISLWARRLALYICLGAFIIVISHIAFSYFNLLHTDVDSARYMLSALVQSEAAIVALVVTLSLVAVQLAAQSYSARVIEVFRRTPDLWILMGIYGVAIFYGLGVLKLIERANPQVNSLSNLEGQVAFSYYLGVFAFVALVPYIWNTLEMLKPSTVINILAERITKESILDAIDEKQEKSDKGNPILPIVDIIRTSIRNFDYETLIYGLKVVEDRFQYILKNEKFENVEKDKIAVLFITILNRIGRLTANREDEDSTMAIAEILSKVGKQSVEQEFGNATRMALFSLMDLINAGKEHNLKGTEWFATIYLEEIEKTAKEHGLEVTLQEVGKFCELLSKAFRTLEKE